MGIKFESAELKYFTETKIVTEEARGHAMRLSMAHIYFRDRQYISQRQFQVEMF